MASSNIKKASFSQGSDEIHSLVCLPCYRYNKTMPVYGFCIDCQEHLCYTCFKHHKKPRPCKDHMLQDQDTMPMKQQLSSVNADTTALTTPCRHHKAEMIKLYCYDHNLLLCSICVALEHTRPCHVAYIPEISNKMINSQDYKDTMVRIEDILKTCTTVRTETFRYFSKSNNSLDDILLTTRKYRKEIDKRMDEFEGYVESEILKKKINNDESISRAETICEDIMKGVRSMYDSIKQHNTSKQSNHLFMKVKQAQKQLQDYETYMNYIEYSFDEYKFVKNQTLIDILQEEKDFGYIFRTNRFEKRAGSSSQCKLKPCSADDTITPTCPVGICVETSNDTDTCLISGMTALPEDKLILADYNNNSIKLVDINRNSITSQLSLGTKDKDKPGDITSTTSTQVAVTLPGRHHIQFISVSDKLSQSHTVKTNGECWGICCYQNKLIVTYWNPGKLEILDMKGRVITPVTTYSPGKYVFDQPGYVQANNSFIYVSDEGLKGVIMLKWDGEIAGRIADLKNPIGLASLGNGSLLICDNDVNTVCQVSADGPNNIPETVLQDVRCPYAVYVDAEGHKLYISRYTDEDEDDTDCDINILVYNI